VAFLLLCFATGLAIALALPAMPPGGKTILGWIIAVIAVILFVWLCVVPFLRWWTTTFTITNRRLITRRGILNKRGHGPAAHPDQQRRVRAVAARPDARLRHAHADHSRGGPAHTA